MMRFKRVNARTQLLLQDARKKTLGPRLLGAQKQHFLSVERLKVALAMRGGGGAGRAEGGGRGGRGGGVTMNAK